MSETVTAAPDEGVSEPQITTEAPAPQEPATPRNSLEAAFDAIEKREAGDATEEAPATGRGPDGRFLAKQQDDGAPAPEVAKPEPLAPPEGFADKALVDWNRLPRSVQEGILSRVQSPPPAPADPYVDAARNLRGAFEQHGLIPERALPEIVGAWQQLLANPREVLPELARRMGVDLGQPTQPQQQDQNQWEDPSVRALREEIAELKRQSEDRNRREQAERAAADQRLVSDMTKKIADFAKDKPDFDAVRKEMSAINAATGIEDLNELYERAVWANPQTRAARIEAERKADEAKRMAEAEKARKAAAINVRSDGRANPAPARTASETIRQVADALYSA
jgi:hypothetical protein